MVSSERKLVYGDPVRIKSFAAGNVDVSTQLTEIQTIDGPLNDSETKSAPLYATPEAAPNPGGDAASRQYSNSIQWPFFLNDGIGGVARTTDSPSVSGVDATLQRNVQNVNGVNLGVVEYTLKDISIKDRFKDYCVLCDQVRDAQHHVTGYRVIAPLRETGWLCDVSMSDPAKHMATPDADADGGSAPSSTAPVLTGPAGPFFNTKLQVGNYSTELYGLNTVNVAF